MTSDPRAQETSPDIPVSGGRSSSAPVPAAAPPEGPKLDEVLSKLRHCLGLLDQITPAEAQDRRTGDLHLTVAELRVLVEAFDAAPPGAAARGTPPAALIEAAVKLAIPYEALRLDDGSRKWIAPEIWQAIVEGTDALRAALAARDAP